VTFICAECIEEVRLKEMVRLASNDENHCEYCNSTEPTVDIYFIADKCDDVIASFYEVSSQTMAVLVYDHTPSGRSLEDTLAELIGAPEEAIETIAEILDFRWYDMDSDEYLYGEDPWFIPSVRMESPLSLHWEMIESSLRNEGRYLNPKVAHFMDTVFGGVASDVEENRLPVLVDAGPGTRYGSLYRARLFQSEKSVLEALKHPERFLGAPPVGIGMSGRMNAAGQPAFYGATDVKTTLTEVRPVVGSWVVIANFSVDRPLKLLDLRLLGKVILPETASLFDEATKIAAQRRDFLRKFCNEMISPVMPERQDQSYLVTQVIANYLATHPFASIDGIIYPSVQCGGDDGANAGENVVLFYKAATTVNADSEEPTAYAQLWEYEEDGPGCYFSPAIVFSDIKPQPLRYKKDDPHVNPTLSLVRDSIEIHEITSVKIASKASSVSVGEHHFNF
jgi:hypothetical protein